VTAGWGLAARAPGLRVAPILSLVVAVGAGAAIALGHEVVTIALLGAALYSLVFVQSPAVALLAYVATRPAVDGFVLVDAGPVTVGQIWGAGLILLLTVFLVGLQSKSPAGRSVPLPILALVALYAVLAARGDTDIALQFGLKLAMWLVLIVAVERISQTRSGQVMCFRAGYALAAGSAVLIGVLAAFNKFGGAYYESFGQAQGTEQSPQALAFLALFSLSFPLIALLQRWWPFLSLALVVALSIEITISYVRTALLALVALVIVYLFVAIRRGRLTALGLAGSFGVTAYVVQDRLAERFSDLQLLGSGQSSGAGSNRVAIWTAVWDTTTSSVQTLAAGGGAGSSHAASEKAIGHFVDAHNDLLEFFATGGTLLLFAYVAFIVWVIRSVWHVYRDPAQSSRARAVAALSFGVIAAFLAASLSGSISFYAAALAFAVLIGLIRGMARTPGRTCFDPDTTGSPVRGGLVS